MNAPAITLLPETDSINSIRAAGFGSPEGLSRLPETSLFPVKSMREEIMKAGKPPFCNDCLLNLTGRRPEEILGRNWWVPFVPPKEYALKLFGCGSAKDLSNQFLALCSEVL